MNSPKLMLIIVSILIGSWLNSCWSNSVSNNGGGSTEGIALQMPANISLAVYRDWVRNPDSNYAPPSGLNSWHLGDSLRIPNNSAIEITSQTDSTWIGYVSPRDWRITKKIIMDSSNFGAKINRIVKAQADSLILASTPYRVPCPNGLCLLRGVPNFLHQGLLLANNHYDSIYLGSQDTQYVLINPPSLAISALSIPKYWKADSSKGLQVDTNPMFQNGTYGWIDGGARGNETGTFMLFRPGLSSDGPNSGVYHYALVMDIYIDSLTDTTSLYYPCATANTSLLSIDKGLHLLNFDRSQKSPQALQAQKWQRIAVRIDADSTQRMDIWVNGMWFWSQTISLPIGYSSWSQINSTSCLAGNPVFYQDSLQKSIVQFFSRNSAPWTFSIRGIGFSQGFPSDSTIANWGSASP